IRALFYYGMEHGYIYQFKIKLIRAEKKIKETYTDAELAILLKKPDIKKCSFAEYRNWVIINYLLATGNRLETMANVKIGDIDFEENKIKLLKLKNRKQYIIPLSLQLKKVLREYLMYRKGNADDYLFCSSYGKQLSKATIQTQIQHYNRSRGVLKTSIHVFRHTFAKNWIQSGGDMVSLQTILGHSSIEMVKEYVNMYGDDLQNGFNMHNPLDTLTSKDRKGDYIRLK
ncbi:MAG: tyrosine-type recombinase/integrase, partial [Eubacterium sp.]|nr:tyrosine-type recombinase/integrase [Eubacterium sp.]